MKKKTCMFCILLVFIRKFVCIYSLFADKGLFSIVFTLFFSASFSQSELSLSRYYSEDTLTMSGYAGEFNVNAVSLSNNLLRRYYDGKRITKEIKDADSARIGIYNTLGGDFNYGIFFSRPLTSKKDSALLNRDSTGSTIYSNTFHTFFIATYDRLHADMLFTQDAYLLNFYGNKRFLGDTANLDGTGFSYFRFQQLQAGIIKAIPDKLKIAASLSLLKGEQHSSLYISKGRIGSHPLGHYIDATVNATYSITDTNKTGIGAFNGWGLSTDWHVETPLKRPDSADVKETASYLRIELNDLGFIRWNNQSIVYSLDTLVHFTGVSIQSGNLFNIKDSTFWRSSPDSLRKIFEGKNRNISYTTYLPTILRITVIQPVSERHTINTGLMFRAFANYQPYFHIKDEMRISKYFSVGARFAYGGYGNFGFGLESRLSFKHWDWVVGTNTVDGFVAPGYSGGNNAFMMMRWKR